MPTLLLFYLALYSLLVAVFVTKSLLDAWASAVNLTNENTLFGSGLLNTSLEATTLVALLFGVEKNLIFDENSPQKTRL